MLAPEGKGIDLETRETKTYKNESIPFLNLTDTRGYELNQKFNPDKIKEEVLNFIKKKKLQTNWNDNIQCIWFCVNANELCKSEISAFKELKNNIYNIPVIVVFTKAEKQTNLDNMQKQIKSLFPDIKFIPVLGRETSSIKEKMGLDELLEMTLDSIKSNDKSDLFDWIKEEFRIKEEYIIKEKLSGIKENIIRNLVEEFINSYVFCLSENDFELYIYNLIEKIILAFSYKTEIKPKTKILIQNNENNIKQTIKSYIKFYSEVAENYIYMIIVNKSFEYLDLQVIVEKEKNLSIKINNKRNREDFINLISSYLKDNFHYVAQKYLIFLVIKDLVEALTEKFEKNIFLKMKKYLLGNEVKEYYRMIYLKVIADFEERINKYKDKNGKIYN